MRVTYTPDDAPAERKSWEFRAGRVRQSEAQIIERQYGKPYQQFAADAQGGSMRALRVLMWHLMRTQDEHTAMRFEDVPDFFVDEIEIAYSSTELREGMSNLDSASLDPAERDMAMSVLRAQIAAAEADERKAGEAEPGK